MMGSGFGVEPYVEIQPKTSEVSRGIVVDIIDTLAKYYKFSYGLKASSSWWIFGDDGSIGGSLGDVNTPKHYVPLNTCG